MKQVDDDIYSIILDTVNIAEATNYYINRSFIETIECNIGYIDSQIYDKNLNKCNIVIDIVLGFTQKIIEENRYGKKKIYNKLPKKD